MNGNQKSTAVCGAFLVPAGKVLSNRLLEDLELLWQLRDSIPDPCNFQD